MNNYNEYLENFADEDAYFYGIRQSNLEKLEKDIELGILLEDNFYE